LIEDHPRVLADVELLPVDDRFVAALVDVHHIASAIDLGITGCDVAALG
jgi:hypothetical protein